MKKLGKLEVELLAILSTSDCGAKLTRFEDWAACHDLKDVRDLVRTDGRRVLIMSVRIPGGSE